MQKGRVLQQVWLALQVVVPQQIWPNGAKKGDPLDALQQVPRLSTATGPQHLLLPVATNGKKPSQLQQVLLRSILAIPQHRSPGREQNGLP
jgi:hypothetical protein